MNNSQKISSASIILRGVLFCLLFLFYIVGAIDAQNNKTQRELLEENRAVADKEFFSNNYTQALPIYIKCLQIAESNPTLYNNELASIYLNIGNIHFVFFDYEQAYIYYKKGYEITTTLNDPEQEFMYLNNLTGVCCYLKKTEEAIEYNQRSKQLNLEDSDKQEYTYILNKSYIAVSKDEPDSAIYYFSKSIQLAEEYNLAPSLIAAPYSELFQLYERNGQLDLAIRTLMTYNRLAEEHRLDYMIVDSYKGLMRLYTKYGDKDSAVYYQELYFHYSDSILNVRDFTRIKNERQIYESTQSTLEIENLNFKVTQHKIMLFFILAIFTITLFFVILIYRQKAKLQGAYRDIFERNKELMRIEKKYNDLSKELRRSHPETQSTAEGAVADKIREDEKCSEETERKNAALLNKINEVMESTDVFCNPDFNLIMLSKLVDSNTTYVSQVINDTFNKNFRTFINEYRIKEARERLMDTENYGNYTIQGIAESVGYKSCTNFISAFKKFTGITPSLYQKMSKEEKVS